MDYGNNNYQKEWALISSRTIYCKRIKMPKKRNNKIRPIPDEIQQKLTYIGNLVKETRLSYGMTQVDFANQQGISKNSLQNLEYGRNVTLLSLLTTISEIYSPSQLFEDLT